MPWVLPEDLAFFRRVTLGRTVVMGRHTWLSLPVRPLAGRQNIVLSHAAAAGWSAGATVVSGLDEVIRHWPDAIIIGGGRVYRQALPWVETVLLTRVDCVLPAAGAVLAPQIEQWFTLAEQPSWQTSVGGLRYQIERWERKIPTS